MGLLKYYFLGIVRKHSTDIKMVSNNFARFFLVVKINYKKLNKLVVRLFMKDVYIY